VHAGARIETQLSQLSFFADLRDDERLRIADRFRTIELAEGSKHTIEPSAPEMVVILEGRADLEGEDGEKEPLIEGDVVGESEIAVGSAPRQTITARLPTRIAVLDRTALDALFHDFPAIAVPWLAELGRELKWRNDILREVSLARAEGLPDEAMESLIQRRRRRLHHLRGSPVRRAIDRLVRALFTAPGKRPSFWVLVGALSALAAARTMVAVIINNGLQTHLFALIASGVGHPIHVHHFNYGLLLVSIAGVLSLLPRTRRMILRLAFMFGFGVGLIVDEFALLWNLNPDYYQPLSRLAAGIVVLLIVQVVYFRNLYLALLRRVIGLVRR
jgi:CRP-like cAMP-binding protein